MNLLFLTLSQITDVRSHGIYTDLMRKFGKNTELVECDDVEKGKMVSIYICLRESCLLVTRLVKLWKCRLD